MEVKTSALPNFISPGITVSKNDCVITIVFNKYFFKTTWPIDVCRGPIHIRSSNIMASELYNRTVNCEGEKNYCVAYSNLLQLLQGGLIYVQGNKYDPESDHNHLYCAYVLIHNYLKEGIIFDLYGGYDLLNEEIVQEEFRS
jgi:hypothetical protein